MAYDIKNITPGSTFEESDTWKQLSVESLRDYCETVKRDLPNPNALYPPEGAFRQACNTLSDNPAFRGVPAVPGGEAPTYGQLQRACANPSSVKQGAYGINADQCSRIFPGLTPNPSPQMTPFMVAQQQLIQALQLYKLRKATASSSGELRNPRVSAFENQIMDELEGLGLISLPIEPPRNQLPPYRPEPVA